jgi:hypothetical protein
VGPGSYGSVGIEGAIVAADIAINLLRLEPAARLKRSKGLLGNLSLKLSPAGARSSRVDVVELLREIPQVSPKCKVKDSQMRWR